MGLFKKFTNWTYTITPSWVGAVVWISVVIPLYLGTIFGICTIVQYTGGYILLAIPFFVLYCFYLALFKQENH